ncbi:hypothetical protein G9A89_007444 [Geosiphon pyriformis]|nr:hypothetical protein G9A89_007444 [Geosiphon pyriformis]
MAIIMNSFLAWHMSKVEKISGQVISVKLLFKKKQLVIIMGLYAGVSAEAKFSQVSNVNLSIIKVVNTSIFMVLGKDFNKDDTGRSASYKFCLDLGLVNLFHRHFLFKVST